MEQRGRKRSPPAPPKALEALVRDWQWTWTRAGIFCLGLAFLILITQAVIPSFLIYYLDAQGCWSWVPNGACKLVLWDEHKMNQYVVQAIVMGWITVTFGGILVVSVVLQNWRRKLRGPDHVRAGSNA